MLSQQLRDARDLVVPPWAVPASKQNGGYNASISHAGANCWRQPGCFYP